MKLLGLIRIMKSSKLFHFNRLFSLFIAGVSIVAVGFFNFLIIRNQFVGDLGANIGSIEISYIQMAKFWLEGGGLWQPLWYLGYPWHVFYTPVLPTLEVLLHLLLGFSFGHSYRVITAIAYILVPISTYLFIWQISKSKSGAFIGSLVYSFAPSVIAFLFNEVAQDVLSGQMEPRRFAILVRWGEGPHTLALVFLPLFGVFTSKYLELLEERGGRLRDLVLAAIFMGLAAMTNAIALWAAVLLLFAFFLAGFSGSVLNFIQTTKRIILILAVTFGLISFWYNLPFLQTFFREGGGALGNWSAMFPWRLIVLVLIGVGIIAFVRKFVAKFNGASVATYWFLMLFLIVFVYYFSAEDHVEYAPQALRLNTEVDLALSVLVGVTISSLFSYFINLKDKFKLAGYFLATAVFLVSVLGIVPKALTLIYSLPPYAMPMDKGKIEKTPEFEVAATLAQMVKGTNQRVLVPGNYSFWFNYFVPVPQIRGALYQSSTHFWPDHIYYQVTNGNNAQMSLAWLKIANVGKLAYGHDLYSDFKVPREKFDSILTERQNTNGTVYFDVPLKNDSLAKAVDYKSILLVKKPVNAIDEEPINQYVALIEARSAQRLNVEKVTNSHLKISGHINRGDGVLVQQTYDSGWRAAGWTVKKDNFDFTVLVPNGKLAEAGGDFSVDLKYGKPLSVYFGYLVTVATIGLIALKRAGRGSFRGKDKSIPG